jgi:catechol 2,3-dioxygenase-like lactoylglutathione lyase family enzyme
MSGCVINKFGTHIKVADIERSRRFYESLGFKPISAYGDEAFRSSLPDGVLTFPEAYRGISFGIGDSAELEIAEDHVGLEDKSVFAQTIGGNKVSAMVRVDSVLPLFDNPEVQITFPVRKYYWDTIEVAFRDPDGFVLVFIAKYSTEQMARVRDLREVEIFEPASAQ